MKLNLTNLAKNLGVFVPSVLPDSPLYPIEGVIRNVELLVTTDPIARAELLLKQDNEKTLEAAKLIENNQSNESVDLALKILNSVNDDFNKLKSHTDEIVKLEATEPQKVNGLVSQIVDNGLARQTVFSEIEDKVHGDTYVAVEIVRSEVLKTGVDTLLTLTNNDVAGLTAKLETAVNNQIGGTLDNIKAVELLNEIARTQHEETKKILEKSETKLAQDLETKILAIPKETRTQTVLAYADNVSGNPVREFESYDVLKDNFKNPETILLTEGLKDSATTNLENRISEIPDATTQNNFVDKVVGSEPQDLKVAIEIEANVAPLQTTSTTTTEVLPIVQKVEDLKANIEQNIIDTYKDKPNELANADFFNNPTLNKLPDVVDIQVAQDLKLALERSPEVKPEVVQVAKDEGTKIVDTFIQNVSNPVLSAQTLNPTPETLATLIDLKNEVTPAQQTRIDVAINAQVNLMQTNLTIEVTDPVIFQTYVAQIESNPNVAQTVANVGGTFFTHAIDQKSQEIVATAVTQQNELQTTVSNVEKEVFSAPISNPTPIQQSLPQTVQTEIQQIKEELPASQIPAITIAATVQAPTSTPTPAAEPVRIPAAPPPAPAVSEPAAPEAPKVGL